MDTRNWCRGPKLGQGSTATVHLAEDPTSGSIFAVKSVELASARPLMREQRILSLIDCPRIVSYMGHSITHENGQMLYNLLMEYVPGGTLSGLIQRLGGKLQERMIQAYTREILQGLAYLHSRSLAHCDIKGRNILIGPDGVKIADLGCAKWVLEYGPNDPGSISGTPLYMAPEVARGEEQGLSADVWALGCTVIEMATGQAPWADAAAEPVQTLFRIANSVDGPGFPTWFSDSAKDFLNKCLRRCPHERWTVDQLLKHPFIVESVHHKQDFDSVFLNSPKSALDLDFWDSLKLGQSSQDPTYTTSTDCSPSERIKQLISTNISPSTGPNWTWEENWVTVWSNDAGEIPFGLVTRIMSMEKNCRTCSVEGSNEGLVFCSRPLSHIIEESLLSSSFTDVCNTETSNEIRVADKCSIVEDMRIILCKYKACNTTSYQILRNQKHLCFHNLFFNLPSFVLCLVGYTTKASCIVRFSIRFDKLVDIFEFYFSNSTTCTSDDTSYPTLPLQFRLFNGLLSSPSFYLYPLMVISICLI